MNRVLDQSAIEPDEIRHQIEVTQAALSEKLGDLESEVKDSVADATKEVRETVEEVRHAFDIPRHVRARPWACVGGAVLLGIIAGTRLMRLNTTLTTPAERSGPPSTQPTVSPRESSPKAGRFDGELHQLKGLALGFCVGALGDVIKGAVPNSLSQRVGAVFEEASAKFGRTQKQ